MDTSTHDMPALFSQLGLPAEEGEIKRFIAAHSLAKHERLERADFWNAPQATFLQEALADDSDWAEVVDQLDALLRH